MVLEKTEVEGASALPAAGPGSLHSLGPKEPMFLLETAGDKAESRTAEEQG